MKVELWNSVDKISLGSGNVVEDIKRELEYIKKIVESYDTLNDKEKYDLLNNFFSFELSSKDFIKLINMKHNRNYTRMIDIPTRMEVEYTESEGHGKDFSWWTVKNRIYLNCATDDNFKLEKTKYSYDEITTLIECGKIYPIDIYGVEIGRFSKDREEYRPIDKFIGNEIEIYKSHYDEEGYNFNVKDEDIPLIMKYISENVKKNEIYKGTKTYLKEMIEYIKRWYKTPEDKVMLPVVEEYYDNNFKNNKKKKAIKL